MDILKAVGKRIRQLRESHEMSQADLAEESGLSDNYIGLLERGERSPSVPTLSVIAKALNAHVSELFNFTESDKKQYGIRERALKLMLRGKSEDEIRLILRLFDLVKEHTKRHR